jgi:hypothetical protein
MVLHTIQKWADVVNNEHEGCNLSFLRPLIGPTHHTHIHSENIQLNQLVRSTVLLPTAN